MNDAYTDINNPTYDQVLRITKSDGSTHTHTHTHTHIHIYIYMHQHSLLSTM
jgi:predicted glycoside hydrolase/deacetylase ChbG (UPF0249 family)